jgi:hypothetical protein
MKRLGYAMAASAIAAAVLTVAPGAGASAATSVLGIPCRGAMSNSHPQDFTQVFVLVHTAPKTKVTTIAHFKTGIVVHTGRTGPKGNARIAYSVGGAQPGFKVKVAIYVVRPHGGNCTTTFTPRR